MDLHPSSELLGAIGSLLTPIVAGWAIWYGASQAIDAYRWQKALDQRTWWYRGTISSLIQYKTAVVRFAQQTGEEPTALNRHDRALHRLIHFTALAPLYAGPVGHEAALELRQKFEMLEEVSATLTPNARIEATLLAVQVAINRTSEEARELIGIPDLQSRKRKSDRTTT